MAATTDSPFKYPWAIQTATTHESNSPDTGVKIKLTTTEIYDNLQIDLPHNSWQNIFWEILGIASL